MILMNLIALKDNILKETDIVLSLSGCGEKTTSLPPQQKYF